MSNLKQKKPVISLSVITQSALCLFVEEQQLFVPCCCIRAAITMPAWHCPPLDNSHVILILIISCRQQVRKVCRSVPLEASNRRESHRSCSIGSPSRIERYVLDPERIAKGSTAHVLLLDPIQIDSIGLSSDGN